MKTEYSWEDIRNILEECHKRNRPRKWEWKIYTTDYYYYMWKQLEKEIFKGEFQKLLNG